MRTYRTADGGAEDGGVPSSHESLGPLFANNCRKRVPRVSVVALRADWKRGGVCLPSTLDKEDRVTEER